MFKAPALCYSKKELTCGSVTLLHESIVQPINGVVSYWQCIRVNGFLAPYEVLEDIRFTMPFVICRARGRLDGSGKASAYGTSLGF